jgi:hypothetical protein
MLRGISVEGRRFDRMPRMSGTMEELGHRLQAFVGVEKSGSFSPLKYKILEYVDWAISE